LDAQDSLIGWSPHGSGMTSSAEALFPSCTGGLGELSSKQSQLGADALSHTRGVRRSQSWAPSHIRAPTLPSTASPTRLRCTTRPWTKLRRGKVNAPRCICPPEGRAPCHTAMRGRASSSQPKRRSPPWLTSGPTTVGDRQGEGVRRHRAVPGGRVLSGGGCFGGRKRPEPLCWALALGR